MVAVIKTSPAALIVAPAVCVNPVAPVRVTAPAELITPPAPSVNVPVPVPALLLLAFNVTTPPTVVVTAAFNAIVSVTTFKPVAVL